MDALYAVALLACPVAMGLCMWLMMRGQRHAGDDDARPAAQDTAREAEIQRLRDELDELRRAQRGHETSGVERD